MPDRTSRLVSATVLLLFAAGAAPAAERPSPERSPPRRVCPEDLPEGAHLPPQPGCDATAAAAKTPGNGFRDLGNGVSVRIGGRAGADFGVRR